jgi:hypothetical protein
MADVQISTEQLKRLQTLYSQLAATSNDPRTKGREERLRWASILCNRDVLSFGELTREEAKRAIDTLQRHLGSGSRKPREKRRMSRDQALRYGKDGRHDSSFEDAPQMASALDLETIEKYYTRLSWSRAQFDGWLRSPRSPLGKRSNPQISTTADANRVRWALKKMLQQRGLWMERRPA